MLRTKFDKIPRAIFPEIMACSIFERAPSKENQKINVIGPTEQRLWPFKDVSFNAVST